jgi:hypothetical protein
MKKYGRELQFISLVKRDGSGTLPVKPDLLEAIQEERFKVICLSMSEKTFIAFNFNCYVVRLKPEEISPQSV